MELCRGKAFPSLWRSRELDAFPPVPSDTSGVTRFRSRKDAEKALSEIMTDGGRCGEFRIDEDPSDGSCVISVLEADGGPVVGMLGA